MKKHISHILTLALIVFSITAIWSFQYVSPLEWGKYFRAQFNIGQTARVEENPMNKLAQELRNKEEELDEREAELSRKEEYLVQEIKEEQEKRNKIVVYMFTTIAVLMLINFLWDWKRSEKEQKDVKTIWQKLNNTFKK